MSAVYPRFLNTFTLTYREMGRKYIASTRVKAIAILGSSAIICEAAPNSTITSSINLIGLTTVDGQWGRTTLWMNYSGDDGRGVDAMQ